MKLDYGSVPAWLGAFSLLLAFRVFLRDQTSTSRAQVDATATWWEVQRPFGDPAGKRIETVKVRMSLRNGSNLPVELTYAALGITTRWMMPNIDQAYLSPGDPNYPGAWTVAPGTQMHRQFAGPITIPPGETITYDWQEINIAHLAPNGASQLDTHADSLRCFLRWSLITDNAGRRWQTRHQSGRPAKRIRWWSRHDEHFPYTWKSPVVRGYWRLKNKFLKLRPTRVRP